jgi:hypothetical protein
MEPRGIRFSHNFGDLIIFNLNSMTYVSFYDIHGRVCETKLVLIKNH